MPGPVSINDVINACLKGMSNASKFYDKLSGGLQLHEAPEWLLQAKIARALGKECHYVTVESSVEWILESAEAERRGGRVRNKLGRIDIVVWSAADAPRFLNEVKKGWDSHCVNDDATRLRSLVNRGGSIHRGLLAVYATAAKKKTLDSRFDEIAENSSSKLLKKLNALPIDPGNKKSWLWSAAVFES